MRMITLEHASDFDGWRQTARTAWCDGLRAGDVLWQSGDGASGDLFSEQFQGGTDQTRMVATKQARQPSDALMVTRAFVQLAKLVVCHSDPERFSLLYGLLIRLQSDRHVLRKCADPLVKRVADMAKAVRRDAHKMTAFVRFRKVGDSEAGREQFVSWFEPTHHIVRHCAPFFVKRFAAMDWCILSPDACARWDGHELAFSDGVPRPATLEGDAMENIWRSYYASIFNPARLKVSAMQSEMPKKYWKNLPEAELIPALVRHARSREQGMLTANATEPKPGMMAHKEVVADR